MVSEILSRSMLGLNIFKEVELDESVVCADFAHIIENCVADTIESQTHTF